jgi:hypothetical protein
MERSVIRDSACHKEQPHHRTHPESLITLRSIRATGCDFSNTLYAVLLTPQKNGSGPLTTPLTFLRQAWYMRKKPVGA